MTRSRIPSLAAIMFMAGGCFGGTSQSTGQDTSAASAASQAPAGPPLWEIPDDVGFTGPPLPEDTANGIALYQPYLDQFSWQMFIAVNWPACIAGSKSCYAGEPDKDKWIGANGDAPTVWEQWANADNVFRKGGAAPLPWGSQNVPPECKGKIKGSRGLVFMRNDGSESSHNHPSLNGYLQFDARETGPLIDQRRRWARFESYLNKAAYDYIVDNKLYNLDGQEVFSELHKNVGVQFPPRLVSKDPNSIEIKAVWRILEEGEEKSGYHTAEGLFIDTDGRCSSVAVGLVAMHIMTKTKRTPMRVWSTFEHVGNLCRFVPIDDYYPPKGFTYISGSFCNAECRDNPAKEGCTPNKPPPQPWTPPAHPFEPGDALPTQVTRVRPLPLGAVQLNSFMSRFLAGISESSVWRNYELVSTQWLMPLVSDLNTSSYREYLKIPGSGPAPQYIPRIKGENACNKQPYLLGNDPDCVGLIVPPILGNTLIETYNQAGASCLGCHQTAKLKAGTNADFSFVLLRAQ